MGNIPAYNSFTKVREAASTRINKKDESKTKKLKEALEQGLADLTSKDEMDMYISTYGTIHQEKLLLAFNYLPGKVLAEDKISVIDYGCGQGIASMVLCDVLQSIVWFRIFT